jgi:hypothetical protein
MAINKSLLFGVELEFALKSRHQPNLNKISRDMKDDFGNFIDVKRDGSLERWESRNGIEYDEDIEIGREVVTKPATLKSHLDFWPKFYDKYSNLLSNRYEDVGMHVHVDRRGFTDRDIRRIFRFVMEHKNTMCRIGGRDENDYLEYGYEENTNNHYAAVNLSTRYPTLEFRMFRSPITYNKFKMNLLRVAEIVSFAREHHPNLHSPRRFYSFARREKLEESIFCTQ